MYVKTNGGMGAYRRRRGLGLSYDAEGMPIEDPSNTTYGATSGGICPGSPGCPGYSLPPTTWKQWINLNPVPVMIGAGAILLVALFAKAGR